MATVVRLCHTGLAVISLTVLAACWGVPPDTPGGPLSASLVTTPASAHPIVRITGWSGTELDALADARLTPAQWTDLLSLHVTGDTGDVDLHAIAVAASYEVTPMSVDVVPTYPLDPGRTYTLRIYPSRPPILRPGAKATASLMAITVPPDAPTAPTTVTTIFPSGDVWPENTLRFYLHFSAPMSNTSAIGHVRLVDDGGVEVEDVLLDIDVDLWSPDYTRRTVFFDPGRVKQGIRPNRELGRALIAGRRYAIVVNTSWQDAAGRALAREFRHTFTAGPAVEAAVDPADWTVGSITPGTREPLVVQFPWALDEGLLQRAVGVETAPGAPLDGTVTIDRSERRWAFVPADVWPSGTLSLVVLTLLEDPAGNRVGEPFELELFGKPTTDVDRLTLPIAVRSAGLQPPRASQGLKPWGSD